MAHPHPFLARTETIQWSDLHPSAVEPDIRRALEEASQRVEAIASQDPGGATYASAFEALEEALEDLGRAWRLVTHLDSVMNTPELREAHNRMLPEVTVFYAKLPLHEGLWRVLQSASQSASVSSLDAVRLRHVEETLADFRENGAGLSPEPKDRLQAISEELARQTQKYAENCLDALNAYELLVSDEKDLAGLPENARLAALASARQKGYGSEDAPVWRFTLHMPSYLPAMKFLDHEGLRRQLWQAYLEVGRHPPHDNLPIVQRILQLRQERADLLGQAHFADTVLARRMARSGAQALAFVEDLHLKVRPAFLRENEALSEFRARRTGLPARPVEGWEAAYWAEKMQQEYHAFDSESLRPYFPIDRVISGLFDLCYRLFGVRVSERTGADKPQVWHPEVRFYDLQDEQGRLLGSFYADWHPRPSKRSGAWMSDFITGGPQPDGAFRPHLGQIAGNLTPPLNGSPALLTHDEVTTVFHEFGHLIHHLLGEVPVRSLNGIHVAWDFVELPSQILENWCWEEEGLRFFARHFESGEPIPGSLVERLRSSRSFLAARLTMRQLSFGKMDLELHMHFPSQGAGVGIEEWLRPMLESYRPAGPGQPPPNVANFCHLFGDPVGYAAGYYSYKWAEVLEADAFTRFQREGILNQGTGSEFRRAILSRGNAAPPEVLFRTFMGRDPDPSALLRRDSILTN